MARPHLSAEHRDEIAHEMVSVMVRLMKADTRIGEKWIGLAHHEQEDASDAMFKRIRPLVDDMEGEALKALSSSWD